MVEHRIDRKTDKDTHRQTDIQLDRDEQADRHRLRDGKERQTKTERHADGESDRDVMPKSLATGEKKISCFWQNSFFYFIFLF